MPVASTDVDDAKIGTLPLRRQSTFPIDDSLIRITDPEKIKLADWIRGKHTLENLSCEHILQRSLRRWHEGTTAWLYEDPTFATWFSSTAASSADNAIFLSAGPGCGKTVLASALVRKLRELGKTVMITYYDFRSKDRRSAISALRSLAIDLLRAADYVPDRAIAEHKAAIHKGNDTIDDHDIFTMIQTIRHLVSAFPELYIIFDGLDECRQRTALGSVLLPLFRADVHGSVKWLITTRADHDVTTMLTRCGATELRLSNAAIIKDIVAYLDDTIKSLRAERGLAPTASIFGSVMPKGGFEIDSNFVWAAGLTDIIRSANLKDTDSLKKAVGDLPRGMKDLYIRSLERLRLLDKQNKTPFAQRLLSCIIAAEQPMRLSEIAHALAASVPSSDFRPDKVPSFGKIRAHGVGLISFSDEEGGTAEDPLVTFEHLTIYDFLTESHDISRIPKEIQQYLIPQEVAQEELGNACLRYLAYQRYATLSNADAILSSPDHALLRYAATYWFHHLNIKSPTSDLQFRIENFADSSNFWTCAAVQSAVAPYIWARYEPYSTGYKPFLGNMLAPPDPYRVGWGIPLPEFVKHEGVRHVVEFARQWHQVLNSYPDRVHQCRMDIAWESGRPDLREWSRVRADPLALRSADSEAEQKLINNELEGFLHTKFCCVLRETIGQTIHFAKDPVTGVENSQVCDDCAAASSDTQLQRQAVNTWSSRDVDEMDKAMMLIRNTARAAGVTLDDAWTIDHLSSSVTMDPDNLRVPMMAVQWCNECQMTFTSIKYAEEDCEGDDDHDSSADGDSEDDTDDKPSTIRHHMLLVARQHLEPIVHQWSSKHRSHRVCCAYHPTQPWVLWSSSLHELCLLKGSSVETFKLEEPGQMLAQVEKADSMYRSIRISKDGARLWYIMCTARVDGLSVTHYLAISTFDIADMESDKGLKLTRTGLRTLTYSSYGWLRLPGLLVGTDDEYCVIALPPLGAKPKILRFALDEQDPELETLGQSIFFPATTAQRQPAITYIPREEGDILVLTLNSEPAPPPMALDTASSEPAGKALVLDGACRMLFTEPQVQGPMQMAWRVGRSTDWRAWDQELDGRADEDVASMTSQKLRGSYIGQDKPFRVAIRSGLDWTKQAILTCRT